MSLAKPIRVLGVVGSPRRGGNTESLVDEVLRGARDAGAAVEKVRLSELEIAPCDACDTCRDAGECVLGDDMPDLLEKMAANQVWVLGTPVYWWGPSAQFKLFMDRWYAMGGDEGYPFKGKKFGIILTYADEDPFRSGAVNALRTFQDAIRFLSAEITGMVYGSAWKAGEIKKNKTLLKKAYQLGKDLAASI